MGRRPMGTSAGPCDGAGNMGRAGREYGRSGHTDGRVGKPPAARVVATGGDHEAYPRTAPRGDRRRAGPVVTPEGRPPGPFAMHAGYREGPEDGSHRPDRLAVFERI